MELNHLPRVASCEVGSPHGGKQVRIMFENGWGASVVSHQYSYGGREGLYELAVLDFSGDLSYDTDITSDVIGNQTESQIRALLVRISALDSIGREIES